ncbi:hypothetical protein [Ensifer soli]|uniref:hypothetical protein n=1 Tax=Ciceribacter sp. sgz301302 TaxID=3342379 RepID=UPI0035BB8148
MRKKGIAWAMAAVAWSGLPVPPVVPSPAGAGWAGRSAAVLASALDGIASLVAVRPALAAEPGTAYTMTFDGVPQQAEITTRDYYQMNRYVEGGYVVTSSLDATEALYSPREKGGRGFWAGSTALGSNWGYTAIIVARQDDGPFRLQSLRIDTFELFPQQVSVTGLTRDGTIVTETIAMDTVRGFQTHTFQAAFAVDVIRVMVTGAPNANRSLDDVVLLAGETGPAVSGLSRGNAGGAANAGK